MLRLRDRADLIALVSRDLGLPPACRRACVNGSVEVLGGFEEIMPWAEPGWILIVTAKHGTVYHLAVIPAAHSLYRVKLIEMIPWQTWVGKTITREEGYSIYQGDHPAAYAVRRETALENLGRKKWTGPLSESLATSHS